MSDLCSSCLQIAVVLPASDEIIETEHWIIQQVLDVIPRGIPREDRLPVGSFRFESKRLADEHVQSAQNGCLLCQLLCWVKGDDGKTHELVYDSQAFKHIFDVSELKPHYDIRAVRVQSERPSGSKAPEESTLQQTASRKPKSLQFFAHADEGGPAAKWLTSRDVDPFVASQRSFFRAKKWLQACTQNIDVHADCPKHATPFLPTRVIDVSSLHDNDLMKLSSSTRQRADYAALSYCWGGPQADATTSLNIDGRMKSFKLSTLPQTLQDAVRVTREMGLQFLWVDAICILQDSTPDKEVEMATMAQVYKNAFVTIIAAHSSSCYQGFLEDRSKRQLPLVESEETRRKRASTAVRLGIFAKSQRSTVLNSTAVRERELQSSLLGQPVPRLDTEASSSKSVEMDGSATIYETFVLKLPYRGPDGILGTLSLSKQNGEWREDEETIYKRAWALQERLLSPRVLFYGRDRLVFRCHKTYIMNGMSISDKLPQQLNPAVFSPSPQQSFLNGSAKIDWSHITETYSKCNLTVGSDKLPALSGLAQEYHRLTGDKYAAGLWISNLPTDLMWAPVAPYPSQERCPPRVTPYRAPSWSWASMDADVRMATDEAENDISLVDCKMKLKNPKAPFGEVVGGELVIRGPLMKANLGAEARCTVDISWWPKRELDPDFDEWGGSRRQFRSALPPEETIGTVTFDTTEPEPKEIFLLKICIFSSKDMVSGLALTPVKLRRREAVAQKLRLRPTVFRRVAQAVALDGFVNWVSTTTGYAFTEPPVDNPDYTRTYVLGQTISITWNQTAPRVHLRLDPLSSANIWEYGITYAILLDNATNTGVFEWTIGTNDNVTLDLIVRAFLVVGGSQNSTSTSFPINPTYTTTATVTATHTISVPEPSPSGLSEASKVGLGLGIPFALLCLGLLAALIFSLRKRRKSGTLGLAGRNQQRSELEGGAQQSHRDTVSSYGHGGGQAAMAQPFKREIASGEYRKHYWRKLGYHDYKNTFPLVEASKKGNIDAVRELVEGEKRAVFYLQQGMKGAAEKGKVEVMRYHFEKGDVVEETLVSHAIMGGFVEVFQELLDRGWDVNEVTSRAGPNLLWAITTKVSDPDHVLVGWFLDNGADPNAIKVVRLANVGFHSNVGPAPDFAAALSIAAAASSTEVFDILLKHGAQLGVCDPLHAAASMGLPNRAPMMEHLFELGIDVNEIGDKECCSRSEFSETPHFSCAPLYSAAAAGQFRNVQFLVEHGADLFSKNTHGKSGKTPLDEAVHYGHREVVEFLSVAMAASSGSGPNPSRTYLLK
ncbi:hypothetical protein G7Y89_g3823 [Cudoniella acicularis]|uniref:Heterokaryon incompatibility domain-containing protein n=1 Tax=Cudoniella acicularis TaxID=354080 RepID=A0A8H4RRW1_9HELO|nr:hypothetical protein G7Y89_g3823 [Cudoniella acicularis]